jgi:hypothetical protein
MSVKMKMTKSSARMAQPDSTIITTTRITSREELK